MSLGLILVINCNGAEPSTTILLLQLFSESDILLRERLLLLGFSICVSCLLLLLLLFIFVPHHTFTLFITAGSHEIIVLSILLLLLA